MQEKVKINGKGIACGAVLKKKTKTKKQKKNKNKKKRTNFRQILSDELTKIYITLTSIYTKRKVFTNLLIKI